MRRLRQHGGIGRGDLDEIAEHVVVADFQRLDAGRLGIGRLQAGDHLAAPIAQFPLLVEIGARALSDEAAVTRVQRQTLGKRPGKRLLDARRRRFEPRGDRCKLGRQTERASGADEARGKCMSGGYGRAHGAEIARAPSPQSEPRQRSGKVGCCLQLLAQGLAEPGLIGQIGDGVEPRIQHLDVGQRTADTAC